MPANLDFSKALQGKGFQQPSPSKTRHRLMLIGPPGTGKTVLLSTLPGPKVGYLFDPNAEGSIPSEVTDYTVKTMQPDQKDIDLGVAAVFKRTASGSVPMRIADESIDPHLIDDWTKEIKDLETDGFWRSLAEQGGWLILDSATYMSFYVQFEVFYQQHKAQAMDMRTDYGRIGQVMSKIFLYLTNLPCNIACSAHYNVRKEEITHKVTQEIDQHGQAVRRIPSMMTDIFTTSSEKVGNNTRFFITTVADKENILARRGLRQRDIGDKKDVTVSNWKDLTRVGLAPFFKA